MVDLTVFNGCFDKFYFDYRWKIKVFKLNVLYRLIFFILDIFNSNLCLVSAERLHLDIFEFKNCGN